MRLIRVSCGVIAWTCLVAVPVHASQRGAHPTPHATSQPTPHTSTPTHTGATSPHSAPTPTRTVIVIKPALASRLQPLLPKGTNVQTAASGFRNQGQFVAAVHVSHNLNIPFKQLKTEMTGPEHASLGQAIHELRPSANSTTAATAAEREANEDLDAAKTTTTTSGKGDR